VCCVISWNTESVLGSGYSTPVLHTNFSLARSHADLPDTYSSDPRTHTHTLSLSRTSLTSLIRSPACRMMASWTSRLPARSRSLPPSMRWGESLLSACLASTVSISSHRGHAKGSPHPPTTSVPSRPHRLYERAHAYRISCTVCHGVVRVVVRAAIACGWIVCVGVGAVTSRMIWKLHGSCAKQASHAYQLLHPHSSHLHHATCPQIEGGSDPRNLRVRIRTAVGDSAACHSAHPEGSGCDCTVSSSRPPSLPDRHPHLYLTLTLIQTLSPSYPHPLPSSSLLLFFLCLRLFANRNLRSRSASRVVVLLHLGGRVQYLCVGMDSRATLATHRCVVMCGWQGAIRDWEDRHFLHLSTADCRHDRECFFF
jgi:hypothetical protein